MSPDHRVPEYTMKPEPLGIFRGQFPKREHPCLGSCGKWKTVRGSWMCGVCRARGGLRGVPKEGRGE